MSADILPDEVDFVFCPEALPEEDLHRIVLVVEGVGPRDSHRVGHPRRGRCRSPVLAPLARRRTGGRRRALSRAASSPDHHRRDAAPGPSIRRLARADGERSGGVIRPHGPPRSVPEERTASRG